MTIKAFNRGSGMILNESDVWFFFSPSFSTTFISEKTFVSRADIVSARVNLRGTISYTTSPAAC